MRWLAKGVPALLAKIGSVLLFIFTVGMLLGYFFAVQGYNYFVLLIPFVSIAVMWHKLDEGAFVFIVLMVIALLFPEFFV